MTDGPSSRSSRQLPGRPAERASSLAPFRHPLFRGIWIATLVSNFGGFIQSVGASWMMTTISGSPQLVALVQSSAVLPIMLLSLIAGAIADNFDRRRVMLTAQTFMLIASATLSLFAWQGWLTPGLLLSFTFLIGIGTAINLPAWQASVGELVPREDLAGAVGLNSIGNSIARSVGPAIGGVIVAVAGAAVAFACNAVSYVGLIFALSRWTPAEREQTLPNERLINAIGAGIRYVTMSPDIRILLLRGGIFGVAVSGPQALMPLVARNLLHGEALTYGMLLGAFGVGGVSGGLLMGRLRHALSAELIIRYASLSFAAAGVVIAMSRSLAFTLPAVVIAGVGWVIALSTFNVIVQLSVPRWVAARAIAMYQMITFGGMAVGAWMWGFLAQQHDVRWALLVSATALAAGTMLGLRFRLPEVEGVNLDPARRFIEPETALEIESRSGPVVIAIEYMIAAQDVPAFLALMGHRRRIRRRDGARSWTLLRDLHEPECWTERYHTPTWLDYVRHNQRLTEADVGISRQVRALHRGEGPPRVRRMIEREPGSLSRLLGSESREIADALTEPTSPS
jgi:MFS family permease